jgi:hypothetical protein
MPASREIPVIADGPAIEDVAASVCVIPTEAPEADGTLAWDEATMVLVTARAGGERGMGWTYAAAAARAVVADVMPQASPLERGDPDLADQESPQEDRQ